MTDSKATRLSKIAREFNVGISTIVDFLESKGVKIDTNPNTKVTPEQYNMLLDEFRSDLSIKKESERVNLKQFREKHESISINDIDESDSSSDSDQEELIVKGHNVTSNIFETESEKRKENKIKLNVVGKIDLEKKKEKIVEEKTEEKSEKEEKPIVTKKEEEKPAEEPKPEKIIKEEKPSDEPTVKVVGRIDLDSMNQKTRPAKKTKQEKEQERRARFEEAKKQNRSAAKKGDREKEPGNTGDEVAGQPGSENINVIRAKADKLSGPTVLGKIDLPKESKKPASDNGDQERKKKRKRIKKDKEKVRFEDNKKKFTKREDTVDSDKKKQFGAAKKKGRKPEISDEDIQKQIKDTLARLTSKGGKSKGSKYRREKRDIVSQRHHEEEMRKEEAKNIIKVTEFVTVSELASMMDVQANEIISTCMGLGLFVSINQRLDAETMSMLAEEFGHKVEFISAEVQESINEVEDQPEDLKPRSPIVTVMGHVDHGKTKLLDYVRSANVVAGEAGGITQHIGAYSVELDDERKITFLDTPGHEAFTAMRARGAQLTDVAIIVVAADDGVKPQTVEAINHAQAAGVPMVFAINKIDKSTANPDKIKEELANMNILVEDWGGKYQSQGVSAKEGLNVKDLLDKVLLEAELLELKANPDKPAVGTVVESSLDKGRGYVATVLVQAGTLRIGDIMLAGTHYGRVKAMYNERGNQITIAGPSTPALVLGLNGAPQAGDKFNIMQNDREAREISNKREQLQREQEVRTQKHITLDEIGRRIAIGNFQELNIIVKGDVDGSVEALSDSLIKLSNEEIQVNIIHKAVGQISEGDILLAAASNAIIVGFQVRPSLSARRLAEKEEIDIRLYSIIYDAINEVKDAMEGMLSPEIREEIVATLEILEIFKITKVGTIAGCMVREGKIKRTSKVRVIRDGIVIYTGSLGALKRFKDDVKEVVSGQDCGLNIENFNDIKVGDMVEAYEETEVKKKL
ncbi:MAG: translation initiation factor IF-2 [Bacteroidales bacterium]|nr:translation initiation factor IF-2 [Bacteroidales bacterium]MBN2817714.1 translation initiation factor IF-2 [Bacteroidales bacterium]